MADEKIKLANLVELKNKRLLDIKLWLILKEYLVFLTFLVFLFLVAYSNLSSSSYYYKMLFQNTFEYATNPKEIGLADVN